jgi:2-methylisocitrate lyase-like PEP mutase family enzyme
VGSARYFEQLGFKATARTPAEFAFSRRLRDGSVGRDEMLAHIHDLVQATEYPPFKQSP